MKTLICGSLAYDTIMVFPDRFGRHILPDQAHVLSVSFTVGEMATSPTTFRRSAARRS